MSIYKTPEIKQDKAHSLFYFVLLQFFFILLCELKVSFHALVTNAFSIN